MLMRRLGRTWSKAKSIFAMPFGEQSSSLVRKGKITDSTIRSQCYFSVQGDGIYQRNMSGSMAHRSQEGFLISLSTFFIMHASSSQEAQVPTSIYRKWKATSRRASGTMYSELLRSISEFRRA